MHYTLKNSSFGKPGIWVTLDEVLQEIRYREGRHACPEEREMLAVMACSELLPTFRFGPLRMAKKKTNGGGNDCYSLYMNNEIVMTFEQSKNEAFVITYYDEDRSITWFNLLCAYADVHCRKRQGRLLDTVASPFGSRGNRCS